MKHKKRYLYYFFHFSLVLIIGILIGKILEKNQFFTKSNNVETKIKKLIKYIDNEYVDEVDSQQLLDGAITNILEKLDPHSVYLSTSDVQREMESMEGRFFGIGVQFVMLHDTIFVTNVVKNGPSEKAGIQKGDRIIEADKRPLIHSKILDAENVSKESDSFSKNKIVNDYILQTLKGNKGEEIDVSVYRKSTDSTMVISIKRDEIPIESVGGNYMITPTLGYIEIKRFAKNTHKEFEKALQKLLNEGMNSLVLDLRGNPGGYMKTAYEIADEFLTNGKLIVYTKNKHGKEDKLFSTKKGKFEKQKIYVLIDQSSASASEIVAGALQDNDRGTIVGRRSFGKGLVQRQMSLGDGSAVRLTISRYYTPTGRSIQKPYIPNHLKEYNNEYVIRSHSGELISKDSIKVNDSLKYITPKGKIVYGGGGIVPDVFVPIDTSFVFKYKLYRNLNTFLYKYTEANKKDLDDWIKNNPIQSIDKDEKILNLYLKKHKLGTVSKNAKEQLHLYLKALLAQNLKDETAYYIIMQQKDAMIQKVLELDKTALNQTD